ncbi:MAG: PA2779 family protein [Burkholderiales bacterium]|nr:PA2779 family protein [Burkholderiales bacterium]
MKNALIHPICRMLIICMGALPFSAYAGMVGTDQVAAASLAAGARDKLRDFVGRSEVRDQLQSLGVSPAAAQARVDAMTDAEVASIAGRIDKLPAGGISIPAVIVGLLVFELIWYFWVE